MKFLTSALLMAALVEARGFAETGRTAPITTLHPYIVETFVEKREDQTRPTLRMLVVGDSVLWGQGLAEEAKATRLVQKWLAVNTERPVMRTIYAHSGAGGSPTSELPEPFGEVPTKSPTIMEQLGGAISNTGKNPPDLILVNGCANDFGFRYPLGVPEDKVKAVAWEACAKTSYELVTLAASQFPKAVVMYVGYFTPFTGVSPRPVNLTALGLLEFTTESVLRNRSIIWHQESNQAITASVRKASELFPDRIYFVPIFFGAEDGYGRSNAKVFSLSDTDDAAPTRQKQCAQSHQAEGPGGFTFLGQCKIAATMHPNRAGAAHYAKTITKNLRPLLPRFKTP